MPTYKVVDRFDPARAAIVIADNQAQARRKMEADRLEVTLIDGVALVNAITHEKLRVIGETALKFKPLKLNTPPEQVPTP